MRSFDGIAGLHAAETRAIAQDARGFIWFATDAGLIRFDGQRTAAFAPNSKACRAQSISIDDAGAFVHDDCGQLFTVDEFAQTHLLLSPEAGRVTAAASHAQRRFAVLDDELVELRDGKPRSLGLRAPSQRFGFPRLMATNCGVVLSSSAASWLIRSEDEAAVPVPLSADDGAEIGDVVAVAGCGDMPLTLLTRFPANIYRANDASQTRFARIHSERNRGIGLAYRGERLWASLDIKLLGIDDQQIGIQFAQSRELPSGGPLLVDSEQSLWIGSISRVLQLPEPEAQRFDTADGLVSAHAYSIVHEAWRGADAVFAVTWQGAHRIDSGKVLSTGPVGVFGTVCASAEQSWYATQEHWHLDRLSSSLRHRRAPGDDSLLRQCAHADGQDFAVSDAGLIMRREGRADSVLLRPSVHPAGPQGIDAVAVLGDRLWLADQDEACSVPLADPSGLASCVRCNGARTISNLLVHQGQLYAAASALGIVRIDASGCTTQSIGEDPLGQWPIGLTAARSSGFWAFSDQAVLRVIAGVDDSLRVVERIGEQQGLSLPGASAAVESSQTLWVASIEGFTRVRAGKVDPIARHLRLAPLQARADGVRIDNDQLLPAATRAIDLEFAALSFKAPAQLRYRHRLSNAAGSNTWSNASASSTVTLTNLQPGSYQIDVQFQQSSASSWSESESLRFRVREPWHGTLWGRLLISLMLAAAIASVLFVRRQRQVLLLRQRAEIAADLHDELGSELASVRVLSSLLSRAEISADARRNLLADLQDSSQAASDNLRNLVAHMKSGTTLGQLFEQLNRLAERLRGEPAQTRFTVDSVGASRTLRPAQYRQLWLLCSEALSNVARHAQAASLYLKAELVAGRLTLQICDDGCGFDLSRASGNGLHHLRERAQSLGAQLSIESAVGAGTSIRLQMHL